MKIKKFLSFLAAAAISASAFAGLTFTASAATVDDLTAITESCTFISQDETTTTLTKDSLSWGSKLLTLNGDNAYNVQKGNSYFNGNPVQNLLQVKQGRNMAIKVSVPCTVDIYHNLNDERTIQAGTTNKGTDIAVTATVYSEPGNYQVDSFTVAEASEAAPVTVYIGASGDVFVAAIDVKASVTVDPNPDATEEPSTAPDVTEAPSEDPTIEPTATPEPNTVKGIAGTEADLVAATKTTTYNLLADALAIDPTAGTVVYKAGELFYNNELMAANTAPQYGLMFYGNKNSQDLNGTVNNNQAIRLKAKQDVIAVKLAAGATVETVLVGMGGSDRYGIISTDIDASKSADALAVSESVGSYATKPLTYTNETGTEQTVYITATADSAISQVKVTVPEQEQPTPVAPTATLTKIAAYDAATGHVGEASSWKFIVTPNDAEGTLSVKIGETTKTAETVLSSGTGAVTFGLIVKQTNLTAAEITAKINETVVAID